MAKQASTVEILAGRFEQARRLEAKQAGTVAGLEGRKVTKQQEEQALIEQMRQGADVSRDLAKLREAVRDLDDELAQAVRIHAAMKEDVAALEKQSADAERAAKKARAPQVVAGVLERIAGEKERVRAVLLEVKRTLDAEIAPAAAEAQRLYGECYNGDTESKMEHGLQDLRGAIAQGLWYLEGRAR